MYHIPGKEIAVADGLSRINGYPSKVATDDEATMASFAAEAIAGNHIGNQGTAGNSTEGESPPLSAPLSQDMSETIHAQGTEDWEKKWEKWIDDPWYSSVVEFKVTGAVSGEGILMDASQKIIEKKANNYVLVEADDGSAELAYRERSGKLSKCVHETEVYRIMFVLHELHGHFSDQITMRRCVGKYYWPTRHKDIFMFCRSCPMCQMIGPLRPTKGLLPVVSIQVSDVLAFD